MSTDAGNQVGLPDSSKPEALRVPVCEVHGTPMALVPYYQRNRGARVYLETCDECDEQEERDANA